MNKLLKLFPLTLLLLTACYNPNKMETNKNDIIQTDLEFSKYSVEYGMNAAFLKYLAEDAIIFRDSAMPYEGYHEFAKLYQGNDSGIELKWEPHKVEIAKSGELGFTYGIYTLTNKKDKKVSKGTYVTIWKKQNDGIWKVVLDIGNTGLE